MRSLLKLACIAALAFPVAPAAASEPLRLAPSSRWNIDYAEDSCRLARRFGEEDQAVILTLWRFQPGDHFRLWLAGQPLRGMRQGREAQLRFGPSEAAQRRPFHEARTGDLPTMIIERGLRIAALTEEEREELSRSARENPTHLFDPRPLDPKRAAAVEYLEIDVAGIRPILLETGPLDAAFAAFDECLDELVTHWGIDVEAHRTLSRRPMPIPSSSPWVTVADYPAEQLARGEQAIVHFRLILDERGRVSDCRIQESTRGEEFRTAVCRALTRRARFNPALDAEGRPIKSFYLSTVIFRAD